MKKRGENDLQKRKKQLAEWIRAGWAQHFIFSRHRWITVEHERYSIILYTLKFALLGKIPSGLRGTNRNHEKHMTHLVNAHDQLKKHVAGKSDPFQAMAEFFGVTKPVLKQIGELEGVYVKKSPLEIADILEMEEI